MIPHLLSELSEKYIPFVSFTINKVNYAIDVYSVQKIVRLSELTESLYKNEYSDKLIFNSKFMTPIVDLREQFGLFTLPYSPYTRAIIVNNSEKKIGIIMENNDLNVIHIAESFIKPFQTLTDDNKFLSGFAKMGNNTINLVKISAIMNIEDVNVN
ncbi:MAG: chemotaxis protein CheW [Spirochaetota bacterium]|nr:chemotaxis protein CheW [Spirochaetota bacterium]